MCQRHKRYRSIHQIEKGTKILGLSFEWLSVFEPARGCLFGERKVVLSRLVVFCYSQQILSAYSLWTWLLIKVSSHGIEKLVKRRRLLFGDAASIEEIGSVLEHRNGLSNSGIRNCCLSRIGEYASGFCDLEIGQHGENQATFPPGIYLAIKEQGVSICRVWISSEFRPAVILRLVNAGKRKLFSQYVPNPNLSRCE